MVRWRPREPILGLVRAAVVAVAPWLDPQYSGPKPPRAAIAAAVRLSARSLPDIAPGRAVEVRVPPFVAVQCIAGPRHTRGTPPNVVETDAHTWLRLVTGQLAFDAAAAAGLIDVSGSRASEVAQLLPLVPLG